MIVDLFAGPGGWSEGLAALGLVDVGLERDPAVCETRRRAGHLTVRADVASYPVRPCTGLIASPPCPTFSAAGNREGVKDLGRLLDHTVEIAAHGWKPWPWMGDPRTALVLEPMRWVYEARPTWVVLEQVPPVIALWERYAAIFRMWGYHCWTGILNAANYGVPQTRKRAFLLASKAHVVRPPEPTHCRGGGDTLFGVLWPWVSMADALGWSGEVGFARANDGRGNGGRGRGDGEDGYRTRDRRPAEEPAFNLTEKARSWTVRTGTNTMKHNRDVDDMVPYERSVDEPSPNITSQSSAWKAGPPGSVPDPPMRWKLRDSFGRPSDDYEGRQQSRRKDFDQPAPTVDTKARSWVVSTGRDWKPGGSRDDAQSFDPAAQPAPTVTGNPNGQWWVLNPGLTDTQPNRRTYGLDEPAPTVAFGHDSANWTFERPATTVQGDPRVFTPGGHLANDGRDNSKMKGRSEDAIKITIHDALVLQSFRRDYPVQGTRTKQFEQVGNAVPPLLAEAVLRCVL